jgi:hypothetical protein
LAYKLLSYLGYGNFLSDTPSSNNRWWSTSLKNVDDSVSYTQQYIQNNYVNIFPILAYQKIYQDFFRWSQWESANPSSYNVDYYSGVSPSLVSSLPPHTDDYWKSDTMFDLKYCNWNKDMLMGVLPNSQFGDVAVLDISNTGIFFLLKRIYHIVMFSFLLNVACMMVLIWKLIIASPASIAFSSEFRSLFEHIQRTDVQNSSGPAALLEENSMDEIGSSALFPRK